MIEAKSGGGFSFCLCLFKTQESSRKTTTTKNKRLDPLTSFKIAELRFQEVICCQVNLSLHTLIQTIKLIDLQKQQGGSSIIYIIQVFVTDYACLIPVSTKPDKKNSANSNVMSRCVQQL